MTVAIADAKLEITDKSGEILSSKKTGKNKASIRSVETNAPVDVLK